MASLYLQHVKRESEEHTGAYVELAESHLIPHGIAVRSSTNTPDEYMSIHLSISEAIALHDALTDRFRFGLDHWILDDDHPVSDRAILESAYQRNRRTGQPLAGTSEEIRYLLAELDDERDKPVPTPLVRPF